jgi:hypothetical protein
MSITIPKTTSRPPASIATLEKAYGIIPASYKAFLNHHDGAEPEDNFFKVDAQRSGDVERFIPASEIMRVRNSVEGFPKNMLPFAEASCGNLVYMNPAKGTIYFWDHEIDSWDVKVADSFEEFLAMLERFDNSQINLKPGQVKRIWVDPNFKPEF